MQKAVCIYNLFFRQLAQLTPNDDHDETYRDCVKEDFTYPVDIQSDTDEFL